MGLTESCSCNVSSCDRSWERHPILEVRCNVCGADEGSLCKRPSGHPVQGEYGRFHNQRYYDALDKGHFGECPLDKCPESSAESKARKAEEESNSGIEEKSTKQSTLSV